MSVFVCVALAKSTRISVKSENTTSQEPQAKPIPTNAPQSIQQTTIHEILLRIIFQPNSIPVSNGNSATPTSTSTFISASTRAIYHWSSWEWFFFLFWLYSRVLRFGLWSELPFSSLRSRHILCFWHTHTHAYTTSTVWLHSYRIHSNHTHTHSHEYERRSAHLNTYAVKKLFSESGWETDTESGGRARESQWERGIYWERESECGQESEVDVDVVAFWPIASSSFSCIFCTYFIQIFLPVL